MNLTHLFHSKGEMTIPSGAGECCAPKLLQTAYLIGLRPLAMAEFWWGPPPKNTFRREGMFYPACQRKCRPILSHMLGGLVVEADPAAHYDKVAAPVRVVWEDDAMAVVEKPTGWLSVPGKTSQPNVQEEARRRWPHAEGPLVVHRLDQDTSGLMVIAKTLQAYRQLQQQFEQRMVGKRYVALLEGSLKEEGNSHPDEGTIVLPLSAEYNDLPRQRVDHAHGAEAVTRYKVMGEEQRCGTTVTRIAFYPQTGRTHQLRLHAASPEGLGHPIVGDRLYGHVDVRLLLHAERIELHHPATQALLHFECPCPF